MSLMESFDKAIIHTFEPTSINYAVLSQVKPSKDSIEILSHKVGFSHSQNNMTIFHHKNIVDERASLYKINVSDEYGKDIESEEITLDTIDNFCKEKGIEKITLLKIDIE